MTSRLNPYLNFRGEARDAIAFYEAALGGKATISSFADYGMPTDTPAEAQWVMHAQLETPAGFWLMVSDTPSSMPLGTNGNISVSLSGADDAELSGYWNKLSDGASILQPLAAAPWGDKFGMLKDKFGITWLVNITTPR